MQEGSTYNIWSSTKFIVGDSNSFISTEYGSGRITMFSGELSADITGGEEDGSGYNGYVSESQIVLGAQPISQVVGNSVKGVRIYNIPTLGNYVTATQSLLNGSSGVPNASITQYANYDATKGYGSAARQRMVVADPYNDNMLKEALEFITEQERLFQPHQQGLLEIYGLAGPNVSKSLC